jgi:molybdopterin/thiamine biosynthesis adenylyltransferase
MFRGDDIVEVSNLNRQRLYFEDIGHNKAYALAKRLLHECVYKSVLTAYPLVLEEAIDDGTDLSCDVAICGVDNNPARIAASQYFRARQIAVIFTAVSADADHGYDVVNSAVELVHGHVLGSSGSVENAVSLALAVLARRR